jgi:hypothetical protein
LGDEIIRLVGKPPIQEGTTVTETALVRANGDTTLPVLDETAVEAYTATIRDEVSVFERFINNLRDLGIQSQLLEAIALALPDSTGDSARPILAQCVNDVVDVDLFGSVGEFDIKKVVAGAASLDLLARYARTLRPLVFPREDIPSPQAVDASLVLFHYFNRQRLTAAE